MQFRGARNSRLRNCVVIFRCETIVAKGKCTRRHCSMTFVTLFRGYEGPNIAVGKQAFLREKVRVEAVWR
jgi:hypothetical protein